MITTETKNAIIKDLKAHQRPELYRKGAGREELINLVIKACINVVSAASFPDVEQPRDNLDALRILQNVYMDGRLSDEYTKDEQECKGCTGPCGRCGPDQKGDHIKAEARAVWVDIFELNIKSGYTFRAPDIAAREAVQLYLAAIKELNLD